MTTNFEKRREYLHKLIGKQVEVQKLGDNRPEKTASVSIYVPVPEYGISLWLLTVNEFSKRICTNAWNWDLEEFAKRLEIHPTSEYTKKKFRDFQLLGSLLGNFDERMLEIIACKETKTCWSSPDAKETK